jgi:NADH:ubiquinone oxidoreductase subunit D
VTGPLLRAAGNPWDLRKAMPYSSYEDFDFKIPVGTLGDNYDRYAVRMEAISAARSSPLMRSVGCSSGRSLTGRSPRAPGRASRASR